MQLTGAGVLGVPIVPVHEGPSTKHTLELLRTHEGDLSVPYDHMPMRLISKVVNYLPRDAQDPVLCGAVGKDHRVIGALQVLDGQVASYLDVPKKPVTMLSFRAYWLTETP